MSKFNLILGFRGLIDYFDKGPPIVKSNISMGRKHNMNVERYRPIIEL